MVLCMSISLLLAICSSSESAMILVVFVRGIMLYRVHLTMSRIRAHNFGGRVLRYQRANQNPYIGEEQTTQWPKEKAQKDKQWFTKHTHKTKDRVTRTTLNTGGEPLCSGMVNSSCSTSGTRRDRNWLHR